MKLAKMTAAVATVFCLTSVAAYAADTNTTKHETGTMNKVEKAWDDASLTTKVKSALASDEGLSTLMLNVDSNKGDVTITGTVKTDAEKDSVERVAKQVEGVKAVHNRVVVKP